MEIIESKITGKQSQETCEDGIVVTNNHIAVIDGSTSKSQFQLNDKIRNGRYCMMLITKFIRQMDYDISCEQFCKGVTNEIKNLYEINGLTERLSIHATERLTASVIIYSKYFNEIWMIGDCQCLVYNVFYDNPKPQEKTLASARSSYISKALRSGKKIKDFMVDDDGRKSILTDLIKSCQYQNKTYAVVDGFDIPMDKIKIIETKGNTEIVLASDGYPFLKNSLTKSEELLEQQLVSDPLCINTYKATKGLRLGNISFDDRSYIRFFQ